MTRGDRVEAQRILFMDWAGNAGFMNHSINDNGGFANDKMQIMFGSWLAAIEEYEKGLPSVEEIEKVIIHYPNHTEFYTAQQIHKLIRGRI